MQARKRKGRVTASAAQPLRIDPHRDVDRARYRYLQMTKPEIVERLLTVEQAYAELAEQEAHLQFELLAIQQQTMEQEKKQRAQKGKRAQKRGDTASEAQSL
jgi:predicted  nucleic acid-binding Zn-ribbon protein